MVVVGDIAKELPAGPRVCILGGTRFQDPASEVLVTAVAERFSNFLAGKVVILTGGMPGVQATFAKGFGQSRSMINLLPAGHASDYGVGRDVSCGASLEERMEIFGQLGQVYLSFEGGPGVAKEAKAAFERGALVLPVVFTGGASGGMFAFPADALHRPACATEAQWECLTEKGSPERTAAAIVEIISASIGASIGAPGGSSDEPAPGPSIATLSMLIAPLSSAIFMSIPRRAPMVLAIKDGDAAAAARILGIFASLAGVVEITLNPVIASLSEKYGRKPFLAIVPGVGACLHGVVACCPGSMAAHAICHSATPAVLMMAITQIFASLGDMFSGPELAAAMAKCSTVFGLSAALGPMAGARLNGVQSFAASAILSAAASLFALTAVPESKALAKRKAFSFSTGHPLKFMDLFRDRTTSGLAVTQALQSAGDNQNIADVNILFTQMALGYSQVEQSRLAASMGLSRLAGAVASAPLIQRLGPDRFTLLANAATASAMCLFGAARRHRQLMLSLVVLSLGQERRMASTVRLQENAGKRFGMGPGEVTAANMNLMALVRVLTGPVFTNLFAWGTSNGRALPGLPYFFIALLTMASQGFYMGSRVDDAD